MFSLIITIVSIALVVALVGATMYHGGDTLTQGRTSADASAFVTGAQQVGGAAVMYASLSGSQPAAITDLVTDNYLSSVPSVKGSALTLDADEKTVTSTVTDAGVCEAINKAAGIADPADVEAADVGNAPYHCLTTGRLFSFKY